MKTKISIPIIIISFIGLISCEELPIPENNIYNYYASFTIKSLDSLTAYYQPEEDIYTTDSVPYGWVFIPDQKENTMDSVWVGIDCSYSFDTEEKQTCDHIVISISKYEDKSKLAYDSTDQKWKYLSTDDLNIELLNSYSYISVFVNHCYASTHFISGDDDNIAKIEEVRFIDYKEEKHPFLKINFNGITKGAYYGEGQYLLNNGILEGVFNY